MKVDEMNVLLTGATGGIGAQTASLLATRGANLLLAARDESRLNALRNRLSQFGVRVRVAAVDLATEDGRRYVAAAAHDFPGGINVLVNNAGINRFDLFDRQTGRDLETVVTTNLLAPMLLTHRLLPLLQRQQQAVVLNVGSIVGSIGLPGQVAYCGSKFGIHGFSEALRRELAGSSIRVVYVAPRSTDTGMNDARMREIYELNGVRTDDTSVVARRIVVVITGTRCERFIGWPERLFVKINALLPSLVDRSLKKQHHLLTSPRHEDKTTEISLGVK